MIKDQGIQKAIQLSSKGDIHERFVLPKKQVDQEAYRRHPKLAKEAHLTKTLKKLHHRNPNR